jgi:hypothetical protein
VQLGPGLTPIQSVCIGHLLANDLAAAGQGEYARDDARGEGRLGSLMRHFLCGAPPGPVLGLPRGMM